MKPLVPCLDCGTSGPWRNDHGMRCRRCALLHERARAETYKPLRLFNLDELCAKCGAREDLTWDHITPLSRGGTNLASNLRTLCRRCNSAKGDKREKA